MEAVLQNFYQDLGSVSQVKDSKEFANLNKINYEIVGYGSRVILCIPGALGSVESFRLQLNELNPELFTIVAFDPPGCGKSRPPNRDYSAGRELYYKDALIAAMLMKDELHFEKFSIIGSCNGGITALIMAALYPNEVERVVIWGSYVYLEEADIQICRNLQNIDTWPVETKARGIAEYGEQYFRKCWWDWVECQARIQAEGGDICKRELSKIMCPTLIVHGQKDTFIRPEHPVFIHQNVRNSELVIMEGGKHSIQHQKEFYQDLNALVATFILKPI